MNSRIVKQLFKKEMLDVLRDKKTVLMMVIVPLIVYPLILILGMQVMTGVSQEMAKSTYKIAVVGQCKEQYISLFKDVDESTYSVEIVTSDSLEQDLLKGDVDCYLEITEDEATGVENVNIYYLSASSRSNYAVDVAYEIIKDYSRAKTEAMLVDANLDPELVLSPIKLEYVDKSTAEESTGSLLGSMLPFMLVVSILMGTMYPAIDTTSGEKERGTLETVLTLPVTSRELIFSKFLAVSIFGIASALLNILSMCGVMAYMMNMMKTMGANSFDGVDIGKFVGPMLIGTLCVFAFAVFVSALSMCVCAFAKSYKEANNYITPVTLVVMLASFVSFLPNVELTKNMALIPVVNICLLLRDLLVFKFNYLNVLIVLLSNVIYGIMATLVLGRIYNSESVMFGDGQSGIQLFEKRSNMKKGGVPTLGDCGFVVVLMAFIYLYVGSSLQLQLGATGLVLSQLLFVAVPLVIAIYSKKSLIETFKLRIGSVKKLVGGVLLGVGVIVAGLVISVISSYIFAESAGASQEGLMSFVPESFLAGLLVIALTPAICEEMFFRGYVFAALENKLKIVTAILINGALFGVFHMSLAKFVGTAFLGAMLCYIGYKTRSILPGIIIHFMNNAFSCLLLYYPDKMVRLMPVLGDGESSERMVSGAIVIVAGLLCGIIGLMLLSKNSSKILENEKI
ncbi:MAG: CPBP family intramembrane metalloprotease [Lachnospiraceae bacterium]|nr:CPBP family intramembrane metalloprotease [Lachnospiraceae bacterium]